MFQVLRLSRLPLVSLLSHQQTALPLLLLSAAAAAKKKNKKKKF